MAGHTDKAIADLNELLVIVPGWVMRGPFEASASGK